MTSYFKIGEVDLLTIFSIGIFNQYLRGFDEWPLVVIVELFCRVA